MRRSLSISVALGLVAVGGITASHGMAGEVGAGPVEVAAQQVGLQPAPDRGPDEGEGPFNTLVIRGGTLIDGTGAPPQGPVDIVIRDNVIRSIRPVDERNLERRRPPFNADHEIDATGMQIMPGFIDLHVHGGEAPKNPEAEYPYKLWLAHGVTTVRGVTLSSHDFSASEQARSERNEIVAPRIVNYQRPGGGWDGGPVDDAESARAWVQWAAENSIDGIKVRAETPEVMEALSAEAKEHGLGMTAHLHQEGVEEMNAIDSARLGVETITHFYGHFESLLRDGEELFPPDYDYGDEQVRFSQAADWVNKIHPVGGPEWDAYLQEHLELGTVFDPTLNIYVAGRDVMRMRNAPWHEEYTLPSLFEFFEPSTDAHGSYYWNWGTEVETAWKDFYQVWFDLVKDYHDMGGRITTGSDSGFIYQTYGFGYIMELEMLREAGLTPLEVVQAATLNGAKTLYEPAGVTDPPIGTIEVGKLADLVIAPGDTIPDPDQPEWRHRGGGFSSLYGTGHMRLNEETDEVEYVGGVEWTIKDGIVYDPDELLADVRTMVDEQKAAR